MDEKVAPLSIHLKELRRALTISALAFLLAVVVCYVFFRNTLMALIVDPVQTMGIQLHFIGVSEGFLAYLKVSFLGGVVLASPIVLWQVFSFVLPGFYKHERRLLVVVCVTGVLLFVGGILFAYHFVLSLALKFLLLDYSEGFMPGITVGNYLSFVTKFLLPFGLVFEMPLFVLFLAKIGMIKSQTLASVRKYALIVILVIAAILTPPDVVSQTLLAAPMLVLYEISILLAKLVEWQKRRRAVKKGDSHDNA